VRSASASASADLPLAVGPAISQTRDPMPFSLTLVSPEPHATAEAAARARAEVTAAGGRVKAEAALGPEASDLLIEGGERAALLAAAERATAGLPVDGCLQPAAGRRKRLFLADMDSTVIGCECIDELADYAGKKAEVAAVTERAMRGELLFAPALRARVAALEGLPLVDVRRCLDELVRTLAAHGVRCVLVSGGFESFAGPVAAQAGFHLHRANRLLDDGARLTGGVGEPILGRESKLETLQAEAGALDLPLAETLAVGDGANDLAMIGAAGLGVAYRAKPVVAAEADARVDHADLTALLYFQGYDARSFVRD
jgi:phosphoserine phosphatase